MEYYVYVDSANRPPEALYGNAYTVTLTRSLRNVELVELLTVNVPTNQYNITNGTNCINIDTTAYTIPNGAYTGTTLASTLTTVTGYTFTYLGENGVFLIQHPNPFTITFNTPEIQKRLGFSTSSVTSVDHATTIYKNFATGQIIFSGVSADLTTDEFIFLDIEEFRTNTTIDPGRYAIARSFAIIGPDGWNSGKKYRYSVKFPGAAIPTLDRLTVRWTDAQGALLNFHGVERNSFLLRITCRGSNEEGDEDEKAEQVKELELLKKVERIIQDTIPPPIEPKAYWTMPKVLALMLFCILGVFVYRKFSG